MKKKMLIFHFLYYILSLFVYKGFFYVSSRLFDMSGESENLGAAILFVYGLLYVATPIIIAVLMRFSLLKWYVDPFAAAEVPLFLYWSAIINRTKLTGDFSVAFQRVNESFCADDGQGWVFLVGLFIFGLLTSFSLARKEGESISYRLISKIKRK